MTATADHELACRELVELVTEYLEGALSPGEVARFEEHLAGCSRCAEYLAQIEATARVIGRISLDPLPPAGRDALLAAFRTWRTEL